MWLTGLVAPRHVGSSQTRARTRVPCIGRQILNRCATREAPFYFLFYLFIYNTFYLFIYLILAALALRCCAWAFSSCGERGLLFVVVRGLLIAVASLFGSMGSRRAGFCSCGSRAYRAGSVVAAHGLSCSAACEIFPDQGLNLCPLHWQTDS